MWTREQLKTTAKIAFKNNYWKCVLVGLIAVFVSGGSGGSSGGGSRSGRSGNYGGYSPSSIFSGFSSSQLLAFVGIIFGIVLVALLIGFALKIFAFNPLSCGTCRFFNQNLDAPAQVGEVVFAFNNGNYMNIVKTLFLRDLFIFLWTLLLIIPGIIKTYEYRMIPYILSDNPHMNYNEAFARSKQMMDGEKWNAFVLDLSFILWWLASIFTIFIAGVFYVFPYVHQTNAALYRALGGGFANPNGFGQAGPTMDPNANMNYYNAGANVQPGNNYYDPNAYNQPGNTYNASSYNTNSTNNFGTADYNASNYNNYTTPSEPLDNWNNGNSQIDSSYDQNDQYRQ